MGRGSVPYRQNMGQGLRARKGEGMSENRIDNPRQGPQCNALIKHAPDISMLGKPCGGITWERFDETGHYWQCEECGSCVAGDAQNENYNAYERDSDGGLLYVGGVVDGRWDEDAPERVPLCEGDAPAEIDFPDGPEGNHVEYYHCHR